MTKQVFEISEYKDGFSSVKYPFLLSRDKVIHFCKMNDFIMYRPSYSPRSFDPLKMIKGCCLQSGYKIIVPVSPGICMKIVLNLDPDEDEFLWEEVMNGVYNVEDWYFEFSFEVGLSVLEMGAGIMICEHFMSDKPQEYFITKLILEDGVLRTETNS